MNHKIVRITETEIEMEDGTIHPLPFPIEGELPTVAAFQVIYDSWLDVFQEKSLLEEHEPSAAEIS